MAEAVAGADVAAFGSETIPCMDAEVDRMTGAEVAAFRHLVGLTLDELAAVMKINPRTLRAWESERDPVPYRVREELEALAEAHGEVVRAMLEQSDPVVIPRGPVPGVSRGWLVAAAARALAVDPGLAVEWGRAGE